MARRAWLAAVGFALTAAVGLAVWTHDTYLRMTGGKR